MLATLRQDRFVSEYLVDLNATRAAIASGYSPHTAKNQASRLLANVNVHAVIERKQSEIRKRLDIQREDIIIGLQDSFKTAKEQGDPSGMIAAMTEIARLLGLYSRVSGPNDDVSELSLARVQEMTKKELFKLVGAEVAINLNVQGADEWVVT